MNDTTMTSHLVQTWVQVTDVRGRTYLEARWTEAPQHGAHVHTPHAA